MWAFVQGHGKVINNVLNRRKTQTNLMEGLFDGQRWQNGCHHYERQESGQVWHDKMKGESDGMDADFRGASGEEPC